MDRWTAGYLIVLVVIVFGGGFIGLGLSEYHTNQCRIEAIKAGVEADKIKVACGIKS